MYVPSASCLSKVKGNKKSELELKIWTNVRRKDWELKQKREKEK